MKENVEKQERHKELTNWYSPYSELSNNVAYELDIITKKKG